MPPRQTPSPTWQGVFTAATECLMRKPGHSIEHTNKVLPSKQPNRIEDPDVVDTDHKWPSFLERRVCRT